MLTFSSLLFVTLLRGCIVSTFYVDREDVSVRIDVIAYTQDEIAKLCEEGNPLTHVLRKSIVVFDDGTSIISTLRPRVTLNTTEVLRKSILAAYGLALQNYFLSDYGRSAHHAYHAIRHLARFLCVIRRGLLPCIRLRSYRVLL